MVFVAMSGGVDSSVAAALLKEAGYDVAGVFFNAWRPDFLACRRGDDRRAAMRAAAHLGISFLTFDFKEEYKREVVDYMIREYKAGRTPNPDVMCNKRIKFGAFLEKALAMGADYIATGHYARARQRLLSKSSRRRGELGSRLRRDRRAESAGGRAPLERANRRFEKAHVALHTAKDANKDQSYFLWTLSQGQLKYCLFPIGDYTKPEVREMAWKFGLPNAEREESQGLCFVGEFKMQEFLEHFIPRRRGGVLNTEGEAIGIHYGAFYYTEGQRHGFTITKKGPNDPPYYVVGKDIEKNTLTVSHVSLREISLREKGSAMKTVKGISIEDVNFISGEVPDPDKAYMARFRYRQPLQTCTVSCEERKGKCRVLFTDPQKAVAPGQSLVLYSENGKECLGGGVIT